MLLASADHHQRPRTGARLRPVSARISESARARGATPTRGPRFPIEALIVCLLGGLLVLLLVMIAGT